MDIKEKRTVKLIVCTDDDNQWRELLGDMGLYFEEKIGNKKFSWQVLPVEKNWQKKLEQTVLPLLWEEHSVPVILLYAVNSGQWLLPYLDFIKKNSDLPLMVVSTNCSYFEEKSCMENGADFYHNADKPGKLLRCYVEKLVQNNLHAGGLQESIWRQGLVERSEKQIFYYNGACLKLTKKEYNVLHQLYRNQGEIVGKQALLRTVWGNDYQGNNRVVDTVIKQLRKKLKNTTYAIETYYGKGYSLTKRVPGTIKFS